MRANKNMLRWMAVLAAMVMLAAACGDDGGSSATAPSDPAPSDDSSSDDTSSDETSSDETSSDDTSSDEIDADQPTTGTTLDCAEIQAAVEAATDFTAVDPTGASDAANLEASFDQSRASLAAIGDSAPEIADDVEQAIQGLDALGAVFEELEWNTDFSSNPQAAVQLATAFSDSDIMGMIGAMTAISAWISTSCSS